MALYRVPVRTMFYTINLSPLLVIKKGFMLIIILSIYQSCPLPLKFLRKSSKFYIFNLTSGNPNQQGQIMSDVRQVERQLVLS